jgi:hypothetical protein
LAIAKWAAIITSRRQALIPSVEDLDMGSAGTILAYVSGVGSLVCYILVLVKMFQHGQTGLGIACILLFFFCGIGGLIVFIYGWVKARDWGITNIMTIWTVFFVLTIVSGVLNPVPWQQLRQLQQF